MVRGHDLRCTGATWIEVAVVLFVIFIGVILISPYFGIRKGSPMMKDATQVRGIANAIADWAEDNRGLPPMPSLFDVNQTTTGITGRVKDTTANIYSMLIFNNLITPELVVSPEEHGRVREFKEYRYRSVPISDSSNVALWDPAFSVTLNPIEDSHASYAHLQPSDGRLGKWPSASAAARLPSAAPMVGMRGPLIERVEYSANSEPVLRLSDPNSVALRNGGRNDRWDNWMSFADGSARLLTSPVLPDRLLRTKSGPRHDVLFIDEVEDPSGSNAFLGIFIEGGNARDEFKAVYD